MCKLLNIEYEAETAPVDEFSTSSVRVTNFKISLLCSDGPLLLKPLLGPIWYDEHVSDLLVSVASLGLACAAGGGGRELGERLQQRLALLDIRGRSRSQNSDWLIYSRVNAVMQKSARFSANL